MLSWWSNAKDEARTAEAMPAKEKKTENGGLNSLSILKSVDTAWMVKRLSGRGGGACGAEALMRAC
jgi:hypothetical protein